MPTFNQIPQMNFSPNMANILGGAAAPQQSTQPNMAMVLQYLQGQAANQTAMQTANQNSASTSQQPPAGGANQGSPDITTLLSLLTGSGGVGGSGMGLGGGGINPMLFALLMNQGQGGQP